MHAHAHTLLFLFFPQLLLCFTISQWHIFFPIPSSFLLTHFNRLSTKSLLIHTDRGSDSKVLLSFHRLEDETHVNSDSADWATAQMSEGGVIGRIVAGVRRKLRKVIVGGGVATSGGELADCSAALMAMLIEHVHLHGMGTLNAIDSWTVKLQADIEMCAVTKHATHVALLKEKLNGTVHHMLFFYICMICIYIMYVY
jgi:hypothetical protein